MSSYTRSANVPKATVNEMILSFFEGLDTPVSLACWLRYKYGAHLDLAGMEILPSSYNTLESFQLDYSAVSFLRKYPGLATGINTTQVAKETFLDCEVACGATNYRLERWLSGEQPGALISNTLHSARKIIAGILGTFPGFAELSRCRFGKGSTFGLKSGNAAQKIALGTESTHLCARTVLPAILGTYPGWAELPNVTLVPGSRLSFVPKDAKTDRPICIEPSFNVFMQLGIGSEMRARFRKKTGIDLSCQESNRLAAKYGVELGLCTVDLKSASDTIAFSLVSWLFPEDWVDAMDAVRSHRYLLDDEWFEFEKFSSMGNGFTFDLQSVLFWSIAEALRRSRRTQGFSLIFGDDLICPSVLFEDLTRVFEWCGFTVNTRKSYNTGLFRESCGSHYWNGRLVTPMFVRDFIRSEQDVFSTLNQLRALSHRISGWGCSVRIKKAWHTLYEWLPSDRRLSGPVNLGDICIWGTPRPRRQKLANGWCGYYVRCRVVSLTSPKWESDDARWHVPMGFALYCAHLSNLHGSDVHKTTQRVTTKRVFTHDWVDFGPWL